MCNPISVPDNSFSSRICFLSSHKLQQTIKFDFTTFSFPPPHSPFPPPSFSQQPFCLSFPFWFFSLGIGTLKTVLTSSVSLTLRAFWLLFYQLVKGNSASIQKCSFLQRKSILSGQVFLKCNSARNGSTDFVESSCWSMKGGLASVGFGSKTWISFPLPWVHSTVTAGKWQWNRIVFHWAWMWKKIRCVDGPSLEQEELLPLMLKAVSKGAPAAGLCWQRGSPWGPDADEGNRHWVMELCMKEGKKEHRTSWRKTCNFNKSSAELWDEAAVKKPFLHGDFWTLVFLGKQVCTRLHFPVRPTPQTLTNLS